MRQMAPGRMVGRVGIAAIAMVMAAAGAFAQGSTRCDWACLESMLDRYVKALVAREPSKLGAAPSAVFTENGQRLELGDGLWRTATGRGNYALRFADVDAGSTRT